MKIDKTKVIEQAKSLFNPTTLILIITVIGVTYFVLPSKETISYQDHVIVKPDEAQIARITAEYERKLVEKQSLIDKLTGQNKPSHPPTGTIGKPDKPPIDEDVLPPIGVTPLPKDTLIYDTLTVPMESSKMEKEYAYDFPLSIITDRNEIRILTFNPYLFALGKNYVKSYTFQRDNEDFFIIARHTNNENTLDGITMTFSERFFTFDGVWIGGGSGFPKQWYLSLDAEFTIYQRLKVIPKLTSTPFIGIDVRYRLFK
jgi:hypothetical protein